MLNDLRDEQTITVYGYVPMLNSVAVLYNGKFGDMTEKEILNGADFYLLDGQEEANIIAIISMKIL